MSKIFVEICLISARGLPRSSLWKLQWYAVGWIDPKDKYCTTIDASGTANPQWKTKFTTTIDYGLESEVQDLALQIEVHSREPLFLRDKLQGTARVSLREFLAKYSGNKSEEGSEDVGSFQLRKKSSDKPLGFIDVSIRVSQEKEIATSYSYLGKEEGFNLSDGSNSINLQAYPPLGQAQLPFHLPGQPRPPPPITHPYTHPPSYPPNYPNPSFGGPGYPQPTGPPPYPPSYSSPTLGAPGHPRPIGPSYPPQPPRTPPPPPPPSNVGYLPTFTPQRNTQPTSYINMPSAGRGVGPGFGVGLSAGALAAGAVIFGDDFMSGFQLPAASSLSISTDPPF